MKTTNNYSDKDNALPPLDVKHGFLSVARRLQSVAKSGGFSIISIHVLCDKDGTPLFWTEPKRVCIEPKGSMETVMQFLADQHKME